MLCSGLVLGYLKGYFHSTDGVASSWAERLSAQDAGTISDLQWLQLCEAICCYLVLQLNNQW